MPQFNAAVVKEISHFVSVFVIFERSGDLTELAIFLLLVNP